MKKEEEIMDFTHGFTKIVSKLRSWGNNLEEKEVVSKLLQSMPLRYDCFTLLKE